MEQATAVRSERGSFLGGAAMFDSEILLPRGATAKKRPGARRAHHPYGHRFHLPKGCVGVRMEPQSWSQREHCVSAHAGLYDRVATNDAPSSPDCIASRKARTRCHCIARETSAARHPSCCASQRKYQPNDGVSSSATCRDQPNQPPPGCRRKRGRRGKKEEQERRSLPGRSEQKMEQDRRSVLRRITERLGVDNSQAGNIATAFILPCLAHEVVRSLSG